MTTIWKFEAAVKEAFSLMMPKGAVVLTVQAQRGLPRIWARVDPSQPLESRQFRLYGTGHPMTDVEDVPLRYVGTFQLEEGALVFHLFEAAEAAR